MLGLCLGLGVLAGNVRSALELLAVVDVLEELGFGSTDVLEVLLVVDVVKEVTTTGLGSVDVAVEFGVVDAALELLAVVDNLGTPGDFIIEKVGSIGTVEVVALAGGVDAREAFTRS